MILKLAIGWGIKYFTHRTVFLLTSHMFTYTKDFCIEEEKLDKTIEIFQNMAKDRFNLEILNKFFQATFLYETFFFKEFIIEIFSLLEVLLKKICINKGIKTNPKDTIVNYIRKMEVNNIFKDEHKKHFNFLKDTRKVRNDSVHNWEGKEIKIEPYENEEFSNDTRSIMEEWNTKNNNMSLYIYSLIIMDITSLVLSYFFGDELIHPNNNPYK